MSLRTRCTTVLLSFLIASNVWGDKSHESDHTLTGKDALGDWTTDAPGVRRKITVDDLAKPYDTPSAKNHPKYRQSPEGAWPKAPEGFEVTEFATRLERAARHRSRPNGDLFLAESRANRIRVLRDADGDGKPEVNEVFATGLSRPFGIAFYPVGSEPEVCLRRQHRFGVRFPYKSGDTKASGEAETIVKDIPSGNESVGGGGHWTRDLEFSPDGKTLYVSVGSRSNVDDDKSENSPRQYSGVRPGRQERARLRLWASATRSAWPRIRRPANSGPR